MMTSYPAAHARGVNDKLFNSGVVARKLDVDIVFNMMWTVELWPFASL